MDPIIEIKPSPPEVPTLHDVCALYVRQVLASHGGNKTQTARTLGIDRRSLYRWLAGRGAKNNRYARVR